MFILKELKETHCDAFLLQTKIWKTHPNKSPLTLHPTGHFCKKRLEANFIILELIRKEH
jgi:hypothetical protein